MPPEVGEQLGGYRLEERVRTRGAQTTYYGSDGSRRVVVKTFSLGDTEDWKSVELFERSVETLSEFDLEGVPAFVDSFEEEDRNLRVLVREFVPGESLHDRLEGGWRPDEDEIRRLARETLLVLQKLHGRNPPIIHRDIKPGNIVIDDEWELTLIDFGVVRTMLHREETHPGTVVGTYGYMAPEQFRGHALPATDLYGLGATLVRVVTGREPSDLPYDELRLQFRDHGAVESSLAEWLDRMLAPTTENRFESAAEARRALERDALAETADHDPLSDVESADTVPGTTKTRPDRRDSADDAHALPPDVAASRILDHAPDGCRVDTRVRARYLQFDLPTRGWFDSIRTVLTTIPLVVLVPMAVSTFYSAARLVHPIPLAVGLFTLAIGSIPIYHHEHSHTVEVGDGFIRIKYQLMGQTYWSTIRTDVDHVELIDGGIFPRLENRLRIWFGVDDYLDVGRPLSTPELRWLHSMLTFCLDRPGLMLRTEQLERRLNS